VVVKHAMRNTGHTQLSLAAMAGTSQTTVLRVLKAKNVQLNSLADLAGAMGYALKIEFVTP
jgi:transcriptional regulator with XRE-family HTH domain